MNMMTPVADPEVLCRKARQFLNEGRPGAARPLVAAARALNAEPTEIALLQVTLAMNDGAADQALSILDAAIAVSPYDVKLLNSRAEVRHKGGDWAGAASDAAEAVTHDPSNSEAKARLGASLLELGFVREATVCLDEALSATPALFQCREALAYALEAIGDVSSALRVLIDGIKMRPLHVSLVNAAIKLTLRIGDLGAALASANEARAAGIANAETFALMGHAFSSLGSWEEAAKAYQDAANLAPENPIIRQFALGLPSTEDAAQPLADRLKSMFDQYASHYDDCAKTQGYTLPALVAAASARHPTLMTEHSLGPVLDLGCGTGLVGTALRGLPLTHITGVDISPAMLAKASATNAYSELVEEDAIEFFKSCQWKWSLIVAADVVPYMPDLTELLTEVRRCLASDGWFVFSTELLLSGQNENLSDCRPWSLRHQARYAHSAEYVLSTVISAGFRIQRQDQCVLRKEFGAGVVGQLLTVRPTAA